MARPSASFAKRQREQAKREKQQLKAARRAERQNSEKPSADIVTPDEATTPSE